MKRLKEIFAKVLDINEEEIKDDSSQENLENWDSFNNLLLVGEIENEFNIKLSMDEVSKFKNFKDIKNILISRGIKDE